MRLGALLAVALGVVGVFAMGSHVWIADGDAVTASASSLPTGKEEHRAADSDGKDERVHIGMDPMSGTKPAPTPAGTEEPPERNAFSTSRPEPEPELRRHPAIAPGRVLANDLETWHERRGREALALIDYPWPSLGYDVVFLPGRPHARAATLRLERRVEVYVRQDEPARFVAHDIAHELGHVVDFVRLNWAERAAWQGERNLDHRLPWYGCDGCPDYGTPAGDWSESFARWLLPDTHFRGTLTPPPDAEALALLERIARP